ncbi:MAG: hypothetical protein GY820_12540 [Gammaproteobacteria bacterium]|nr:hypothetical protein [Gammaproteobacteria bacterium]
MSGKKGERLRRRTLLIENHKGRTPENCWGATYLGRDTGRAKRTHRLSRGKARDTPAEFKRGEQGTGHWHSHNA